MPQRLLLLALLILSFTRCQPDDDLPSSGPDDGSVPDSAVTATFSGRIDLADPHNYANQPLPDYVTRDNTAANPVTDAGATLGRVLFYDVKLSADQTISCASCHRQELAFGDDAVASVGVAGTTGRHGMRLTNARFGDEVRFFWDERAATLEAQTTQPIRDHVEMGFSGADGDPGMPDLLDRLNATDYYGELFTAAFGTAVVTEDRMQRALAQFIRSLQSFDSRYDAGRARVRNDIGPFPNFTAAENRGKDLFLLRPDFDAQGSRIGGGLGCAGCHQPPEFSIAADSRNNGVVASLTEGERDLTVTRSPSLRDVFLPNGAPNGPFMHTGRFRTLEAVLDHYDAIDPTGNNQLDRRLRPGGYGQRLRLTDQERADVVAFLRTLTGAALYADERWADPFAQ